MTPRSHFQVFNIINLTNKIKSDDFEYHRIISVTLKN